jgi:MFS family permease
VAEILSMAGTMHFPALQPVFEGEWHLSGTAAGWINGVFFAGYAAATPLLVSLTDRIDPRRIYIPSVILSALAMFLFAWLARDTASAALWRLLAGIGLAGTYMPGLRALSDYVGGPLQSRYVAFYTASFAVGSATSVFFSGLLMSAAGWRHAAWVLGLGPLASAALFAVAVPIRPKTASAHRPGMSLDPQILGEVLRNRAAMGYVMGYAVHCWELFGYRSWLVAFLAFSASLQPGSPSSVGIQGIATLIMLLGVAASILGNEGAMGWGRRRAIRIYMAVSAVVGVSIGFCAAQSFWLVTLMAFAYGVTVMLDSGALTAGLVARADNPRRGMTMALYSFAGFGMACLAPLVFGAILDLAGRTVLGWGLAFASLGIVGLTGIFWLALLRAAPVRP